MNQGRDSWSRQVWSLAFGLVGLAIGVRVMVAVLAPLLPLLLGVAVAVGAFATWNAWRWR